MLDALRDFYTNRLDDARDAITASQAAHHQARSSYERQLASVEKQLAAKEEVVDRYLTEYEDNKIDRDTVAHRIEKISDQIRKLRHQRDELIFLLDMENDEPATTHLNEIRDRITEIIATGSVQERKTMCDALLAELRIDGGIATPVIRIPLSRDDAPAILQPEARTAQKAVRARPPSVELLTEYSNNPGYLTDLRTTLKAVSEDDPTEDEPPLGGDKRVAARTWSMPDRLGEERIREIVERYQGGVTAPELADKFSVSLSSIRRLLRRYGGRLKDQPPT